jgi:hypothetical protein
MLKVCVGSFYLWSSVRSRVFNNVDSNEILCLLLQVYECIVYIFYLRGYNTKSMSRWYKNIKISYLLCLSY